MSDFKYTFTTDQFPNNTYDSGKLDTEIRDSSIVVSLNYLAGDDDQCDMYFRGELGNTDLSTLSGVVAAHEGVDSADPPTLVDVNNSPTVSLDEVRDIASGKLRVHQTSRKQGMSIHWTSRGDSREQPLSLGEGSYTRFEHKVGDPIEETIYVDFNLVNNETYIHEVILTWKNCQMDELTVDIVTDTCTITGSLGSNYATYGDMVVPVTPGYGNVTVLTDLTQYVNGLVYMPPPGDPGVDEIPAFWEATWSGAYDKWSALTPNYYGTGEYNLFHNEAILNRAYNSVALLGDGFQIFNSSDTDRLGHGMRLKITHKTVGEDHNWSAAAIIVMHREKVVGLVGN